MSTNAKRNVLLVDGNNVIHAWDDLLRLHQQRRGAAHTELCRRLTAYQDFSGTRVVLVFDGRGPQLEQESPKAGIQIFYTDSSNTADDVIERLANKYGTKFALTVSSNDIAVQDAVIGAGGEAMSADMLQDMVERSETDFRSRWGL